MTAIRLNSVESARAMPRKCLVVILVALVWTAPVVRGEGPGPTEVVVIDGLALFASEEGGIYRVCPVDRELAKQPFCRQFTSPMLGACANGDDVFIVLANGDLHHVNNALIGVDGGYEPVFHPDKPLQLVSAWLPNETCLLSKHRFPEVFAVNRENTVLHFAGENWHVMN